MMSVTIIKSLWTKREWILWPTLVLTGAILLHGHKTVTTSISTPVPGVEVVTTSGPITTKLITQYITDPAQQATINTLLAENKKYKIAVSSLTSSIGTLKEVGGVGVNGGTITPDQSGSVGTTGTLTGEVASTLRSATHLLSTQPQLFTFKDFQLTATYTGTGDRFNYTLSQSFNVVTTRGKSVEGTPISLVKLFQLVEGKSVEVPVTTTEIESDPNPLRWMVKPSIQGGVGFSGTDKVGVIALQWLKRGTTPDAEDVKWALFSPAYTVGKTLTILPVSINIGQLKHNPLSNIWLSPSIDLNKKVGVLVTATF